MKENKKKIGESMVLSVYQRVSGTYSTKKTFGGTNQIQSRPEQYLNATIEAVLLSYSTILLQYLATITIPEYLVY